MRGKLFSTRTALAVCFSALLAPSALGQIATGTFTQGGQGTCPKPPNIDIAFIYLLTDGTVMTQSQSQQASGKGWADWWRLAPDNTGSYACGTWTQLASIPSTFNYGPRFYAAAVLPDGRFAIAGGEYNFQGSNNPPLINKGAIYLPRTNQWLPLRPPTGWTTIGDAQSTVLPNGTWMIADAGSKKQAYFNANNLTFTPTGTNFASGTNDEAAWTLLPDGSIFTTDNNVFSGGAQNGERWINGSWVTASTLATQQLFDGGQEMGPQVLLPDGTVLAIGGTGNVSIYTPPPVTSPPSTASGTWANTRVLPATCGTANNAQCGANDAAAVLLPSGNVLLFAGQSRLAVAPAPPASQEFPNGSHFFEFDRSTTVGIPPLPPWNQVTEPAALATQLAGDPSYVGSLMMLPNGQAMFTDGINAGGSPPRNAVWFYQPNGTPNAAWKPSISSFPAVITRNLTYNLFGTLFNGMSQANFYGDDAQNATNFPIVQVTINATGHVYYGRTHDHSSMGVAQTTLPVSTKFELWSCPQPAGGACVDETGLAQLRVIANGIASDPVSVLIN
jgi:hypothetical protein